MTDISRLLELADSWDVEASSAGETESPTAFAIRTIIEDTRRSCAYALREALEES